MRILSILLFILAFGSVVSAQNPDPTPEAAPTPFVSVLRADGCPVMPAGFGCLTQAEMNAAAAAIREAEALKIELAAHKQALADKDKIIDNLRTTFEANEAELKAALHLTETELAAKTGELIGIEAQNVQQRAIIEVLLKATKKKCMPFSICF